MKELILRGWESFFLSPAPFDEMREEPKPVVRGLLFVVLVALAVALVGLVGTTLSWATSPRMADIQDVVLRGLARMEWFQEMQESPRAYESFQQTWNLAWQIFPQVFAPNPGSAAARIIILPLGMIINWLLWGLLGHVFARAFGGEGTLAQTLGCTALATSPQLLNLITLLPYTVVGGIVGTWVLLARYVALKTCHRLSWGRALWSTLLPYVVLGLVIAILALVGSLIVGAVVGTVAGGMSQ
jgi:hypothetical protein